MWRLGGPAGVEVGLVLERAPGLGLDPLADSKIANTMYRHS